MFKNKCFLKTVLNLSERLGKGWFAPFRFENLDIKDTLRSGQPVTQKAIENPKVVEQDVEAFRREQKHWTTLPLKDAGHLGTT